MPRSSNRRPLQLTEEEHLYLQQIAQSRKAPVREVQRAQIMLKYHEGSSFTDIQKQVNVSRPTIYKCIDKALAAGIYVGLRDHYHRPFEPTITDEAKAWVINLACTKPKDHGLAAEFWTFSELAKYTRKHAPIEGHECLKNAAKATIWRILNEHPIKPHKTQYYLEKRDPEFEQKMVEVLMVYQEVNLQNEQEKEGTYPSTITVSLDEKPGIQAIQNVSPDLPPEPGDHDSWGRDYEYKRLGTLSLLAGIDLHTGNLIAQVHERHRSKEFISLLMEIDEHYPPDHKIRLILDNHSSHVSKETMAFLASRPGRFVYVHTPKHGSWLNLIETVFAKIARRFLRGIRVNSKEELKERILRAIKELNEEPVVHRWRNFDLLNQNL